MNRGIRYFETPRPLSPEGVGKGVMVLGVAEDAAFEVKAEWFPEMILGPDVTETPQRRPKGQRTRRRASRRESARSLGRARVVGA